MSDFMHRFRWSIAVGLAFGVIIGALIGAGMIPISSMIVGPPIKEQAAEVLNPLVKANGEVRIRYVTNRTRSCAAMVAGFLIDPDTGEAVHRYDILPAGYGPVDSRASVLVVKRMPPGITGRVCYRSTTLHACQEGQYTTRSPDACFEVLP